MMTEKASQELRYLYSQFISESAYKAIMKELLCVKLYSFNQYSAATGRVILEAFL